MDDTAHHSRTVIAVLAGQFLADIGARRYSPRTLAIYRLALRDFDRFLQQTPVRRVSDVTAATVEQYRRHLRQREFSPAGEETYTRAARRFFGYLEETQRVFDNPFAAAGPIHQPRPLMPVPTEEEMRAVLAAPDTATARGLRTRAVLETAYSTGARLEELARLQLGDLDLSNGTARILGKGRRERVVPLGAAAIAWVSRYVREARARQVRGGTSALWVTASGRLLGPQGISRSIQQCARAAGTATPITPHAIRRACVTHMLRRGAHPVQLQMLLGHASLRHLSQYLRLSIRELQAAHQRSPLGQ